MKAILSEVLRRFLPRFLETAPVLPAHQHRAIWAITHCRTAELGGNVFKCHEDGALHFAFHSCNHKACPQCGRQAAARWVERELAKRVNAPYFLVTFTLPSQLRSHFFGPHAKAFFDLFFAAVSGALSEKLATAKGLRAHRSGFISVLHTWNQQLGFHPHIHCLVPGAGLNPLGKLVCVKDPKYLLKREHLQAAFRQHMRRLMDAHHWQADPSVWTLNWGVNIQPVGSGILALKYLAAYVARTAISDKRILDSDPHTVTFTWKDRSDHNRRRQSTLSGIEFVTRYLRHVLPKGLRSVRYYGFCHPAAKANRLRIQSEMGMPINLGAEISNPGPDSDRCPRCPRCGGPMRLILRLQSFWRSRGPPSLDAQLPLSTFLAA